MPEENNEPEPAIDMTSEQWRFMLDNYVALGGASMIRLSETQWRVLGGDLPEEEFDTLKPAVISLLQRAILTGSEELAMIIDIFHEIRNDNDRKKQVMQSPTWTGLPMH